MITKQLQQLEAAKAKVTELENAIAAERTTELAALPGKYGFESAAAFIAAVRASAPGKGSRKTRKASGKKRTRAVITDETRVAVKKLVEAGKSGAAIAKELKISVPSVQNIKKALGLVKAKKK